MTIRTLCLFSIIDPEVNRLQFLRLHQLNGFAAILEQILDTKLTETEAEGRLRMQGMSKDDLIEQILKGKVRVIEIMVWHGCLATNADRPIPHRRVLLKVNHLPLAINPEDPRTQSKGTTLLTNPTVRLQMESTLVQSTNSLHSFKCMATTAVEKGLLTLTLAGAAMPRGCKTRALPWTACRPLPIMRG